MIEVLTMAGAEMRIINNNDGTYTAYVGKQQQTFKTMREAFNWFAEQRDGAGND